METPRIDKWLWSVRLFKTRTMAAEACHKGHIMIDGLPVKASRVVKPGDVVQVRRAPIWRSYKALGSPPSRVGAKEVEKFVTDVTPAEELAQLEMHKLGQWITRDPGAGRPTKKDRRDLLDFFSPE
ncbi:MAG TPA: RNA-binding S4 domain-containing protein [Prolixibacteraceae bacterium]|nr:RNA-binding S4 domain-containing protein [Prolixibacteraceae bacterium]HPJ79034.1 RNA-binding S4 domain-containing protein [Prolixibacteraceae bacterium]